LYGDVVEELDWGVGEVLKQRKPGVRVVAIEPAKAAVLSGGPVGNHMIQGIGAGFVPEVLNTKLIDEVLLVSNEEAIETARKLAALDGIPVGISSGAALACAMRVARREEMKGRTVVTVLPDCAERYLSTVLFDGYGEA
jgi:cysteine synthase A